MGEILKTQCRLLDYCNYYTRLNNVEQQNSPGANVVVTAVGVLPVAVRPTVVLLAAVLPTAVLLAAVLPAAVLPVGVMSIHAVVLRVASQISKEFSGLTSPSS